MEPGGDPQNSQLWQSSAQRHYENIAPPSVVQAHPAQVPIELSPFEKVGERELLENGRTHILQMFGVRDVLHQTRRQHHPAEAQRRREGLACRADVGGAFRRDALERANRFAVVAKLGIVVVLDDDGVSLSGLFEQGSASLRRQSRARGKLMRWRHEHGGGIASRESIHDDAVLVHGDRQRIEARGTDAGTLLLMCRIFFQVPAI
jgi:hypothetical protein